MTDCSNRSWNIIQRIRTYRTCTALAARSMLVPRSPSPVPNGLDQIRCRWSWYLLREVPVVTDGHMTGAMKALHMANNLGDDAAQSVADGQDTGAVELRGLHMQ